MTLKTKTAGDWHPEAAFKLNRQLNFIAEVIEGQASGAQFIRELDETICDPDRLFRKIMALNNSPAALQGFCRELQKFIERGQR